MRGSDIKRGWIFALVLATGCYTHTGTERVIDLKRGTATLTLTDLRTDEADPSNELGTAANSLLAGSALEERYPAAHLSQKDFQVRGEALDFTATFTFDDPSQVGVQAWDRGGYRLCPSEPDMVISASNASYRDDAGCVIWKKRATVLRITETRVGVSPKTSLLGAFQAWDAAGRPKPEEEAAAPASPPSP